MITRFPALSAAVAQAIVAALATTTGHMTPGTAGALEAAAAVLAGAGVATQARPVHVPALVGVLTAAVTLLAGLTVPHATAGGTSVISVAAALLGAYFTHSSVTTVAGSRVAAAGGEPGGAATGT